VKEELQLNFEKEKQKIIDSYEFRL
jgi:hypothetical protein